MNYYFSSLSFNGLDYSVKLVNKKFKKVQLSLLQNLYITEFLEKKLENH